MTCNVGLNEKTRIGTPIGDGAVIVGRTTRDEQITPNPTQTCALKLAILGYYIGLSEGAELPPKYFDVLTCNKCGNIVEATFIFPK